MVDLLRANGAAPRLSDLRSACSEPHGFWLDSALVDGNLAVSSAWGSDPFLVMTSRASAIQLWTRGGTQRFDGKPFEVLRTLLSENQHRASGGAVGYLAYELKRFIEDVPETAVDDLRLPECYLAFYEHIRVFDAVPLGVGLDHAHGGSPLDDEGVAESNFTREAYERGIQKALNYIKAGDIYQVNLSQRFQTPLDGDPFDAYLRLRSANPAPFGSYLGMPEAKVLSASPERFLSVDPRTRRVVTRPIKGTRPRGRTPDEDEALARELLRSEKDRAENVMIVDLERNDLGRVAEIGSVRVTELAALERFPTVFHLTSEVEANLGDGCDTVDLLQATFPGGSITGAPKIRAMEIIDELEPTTRGVYTGAIGCLGFDGSVDLNIAIRTAVVKDGFGYFQAGGGIVADSQPELEYEETLHKASAMRRALAPTGGRVGGPLGVR